MLGHDPWSRPIATVGGAISTNGVGYTAARHGSMGEQVLGLEAVLADGEVIRTRGVPKPSYGPSLNHLFIGSEGTFGVITEATLRAFPVPEKRAATSSEGCIVLNLQRMNAILNISKEDMTARLQAGVVLQDAASAMEEVGLVLGHDPWSRPIATVGGAISTNGVGYTAARHGSMGEQVLGWRSSFAG